MSVPMTSRVVQIIDDSASNFQYTEGTWSNATVSQAYGGGNNTPGSKALGSFSVDFEGTSIAFVGIIPSSDFSAGASVCIDNTTTYNITYPASTHSVYTQWYQTPELPPGKHTVKVEQINTTSVDFAFVESAPDADMGGKAVFVDDDDPDINYSSTWATNTHSSDGGSTDGPNITPVGNSTHRCTLHGSTFSYQFEGTSISVYGFFSWSLLGTLITSFTIDDNPPVNATYSVDENTPQFKTGIADAYNFLFFSQDGLTPQQHTLSAYITPVGAQAFIFDYMTYTAIPKVAIVSPGSNSQSSSGLPAGPTGGSGQGNFTKLSTSKGPLIGGLVGGINLLLFVAFLLFVWMRRRRRATQSQDPAPTTTFSQKETLQGAYTPDSSPYSQDKVPLESLQTSLLSPLRPGSAQENPTLAPFYANSIYKAPSTPPPPDSLRLAGTSIQSQSQGQSQSTLEELARRERLFNFGPRPPPVPAAATSSTTLASTEYPYDTKGGFPPSPSSSSSAPPPLPPLPSTNPTSRPFSPAPSSSYPTPSQSPAPPAYDALSMRTATLRRPPTYRRTRISEST